MEATVILNTFNANQNWLQDAVESYQLQKGATADILISTVAGDPSLSTLAQQRNVRFCVSDEKGIYRQLNKAVTMIECKHVTYAADDDIALPHKLADEINLMNEHNAEIVSSAFIKTDENLQLKSVYKTPSQYDLCKHLDGNFVSDCSMLTTSLLRSYMPFDLNMGNMAHWDFWLRIASRKEPSIFYFNPDPTWLYRQHNEAQHIARGRSSEKLKKNNSSYRALMKKHERLLDAYGKEHYRSTDFYSVVVKTKDNGL